MSKTPFKKLKQFLVTKILGRNVYDLLTGVSILAYGIIFSYFTVLKHHNFCSFAWDLGLFNQAFYTTLFNGKLFYYTAELWINPSGCFFGVHFSPILFLLLPVYAIYPSAESLLVAQSFLLAMAALPLYLLSTKLLKSKRAGFALVIAYLLYPPLHGANWFDFHPQAFIPILIFSVYYFAIKKSWKLYFVSVALALMIQEHLVYIIFLLAFYNLFVGRLKSIINSIKRLNRGNVLLTEGLKQRIIGSIKHLNQMNRTSASISTMIICVGWFLLTKLVKSFYPITPEFLDRYQAKSVFKVLGFKDDILLLPIYVILNPLSIFDALKFDFHIKFLYIILLFGPLLFLSLRSKVSLITLVILIPMLLTNYMPYYTLGAQYPLYLIPLIFIAAIDSLSTIQVHQFSRPKSNPTAIKSNSLKPLLRNIFVVSMIFTISTSPLSPFAYTFTRVDVSILWYSSQYLNENYVEALHSLLRLIPPNTSILTQNEIFPHVSSRINAYLVPFDVPSFHEGRKKSIIENYTRQMINNSEYVLLNVQAQDYWTNFIRNEISNGQFGIYALTQSFVLFKRSYSGMPMFMPNINYELFLAYRDLNIYLGEIVYDESSKSGYVALSRKGIHNGTFIYGPYVCLPPGTFNVTFEVRVQEHEKGHIASFDVVDELGIVILARKHLYDTELSGDGWSNVTLTFSTDTFRSNIEFRIFTSGLADVYADRVIVETSESMPDIEYQVFPVYRHLTSSGEIVYDESSKSGYVALSRKGIHNGTFIYGPYICLPSGTFNVTFEIKAGEHNDSYIATLDVSENYGKSILSRRDIYGFELQSNEWTNFTISFTSTNPTTALDFQAFSSGDADLYIDRVIVNRTSTIAETDFGLMTFGFKDLSLVSGYISEDGFFVHQQNLTSGFFWWGPYMSLPSNSSYKVTFFLKISPLPQGPDEKIITLDVTSDCGINVLAGCDVYSSSFLNNSNISNWRKFTIQLTVEDYLENVEFRGINPSPNYNVYLAFILVEKVS